MMHICFGHKTRTTKQIVIIILYLILCGIIIVANCITPLSLSSTKMKLIKKISQENRNFVANISNISLYPVDFILHHDVYTIILKSEPGMDCTAIKYYIALNPLDSSLLWLANVDDFNMLLLAENISVPNDSFALSIAMFYFICNNLYDTNCKWWIINDSKQIPGHIKMLHKFPKVENDRVSARLALTREDNPDFWNKMIQIFQKIYMDHSLIIDSLISSPSVIGKDTAYIVSFYTWEYPDGCVRKWRISITRQGIITGYMSETIAMWIGSWTGLRGFYNEETFNFKWGTIAD